MANQKTDLQALNDLIASTLALIEQFRTALAAAPPPSATTTTTTPATIHIPQPLLVLRDAAKLLKAHTTKIGLLAINKPFTPTAISKVIREMAASCLPALVSSAQACEQQRAVGSAIVAREVRMRVYSLLVEMAQMLREIETIGRGTASRAGSRDSLSSTGVIWQCCDALVELERKGVAGLAVQKAEQYRDTVKDALDELMAWKEGDGDPDTEGRDELLDSDDEAVDGDHDDLDGVFNAANAMPADRPDIEALLASAESKLTKIGLLYRAMSKRRLKTFPQTPVADEAVVKARIARLDNSMSLLESLPDQVDDLAASFYSLKAADIENALKKCVNTAREAVDIMQQDWKNSPDEFTTWCERWKEVVG